MLSRPGSLSVVWLSTLSCPVVSEYTRNYLTLSHDMVIKRIHNPRSTVHEGFAVIFRVLAYSVTRKTTHTMIVNNIGCFLQRPHLLRGSETIQNRKLDKTADETVPLCYGILKYILWGFRGSDISRLAVALAMGYVAVVNFLVAKCM